MAKILISPLGVGSLAGNVNSPRAYRTAFYHLDGKIYESSFVASVLYKHLKLDGIIFIGTVKSMWEEVYRFFCEENELPLDENYWFELAETLSTLNQDSELSELNLSGVEKVLGNRSRCVLTKYGLTETELWENFDTLISVINQLNPGDEIYIDISHSFRSLSLFLFIVLVLIKDIYSERDLKVSGVYYGMLDVIKDLGYAPIINLQSLFDITDWIKGTYSLKTYGDASLIANLLQEQGETELSQELQRFSQAVNLGYLPNIKNQGKSLQQKLKSNRLSAPFKYLQPFVSKFLKRFPKKHESDFQLELAGWYFENQRYATGYLTMTEAILTYLCEIEGKDPDQEGDREFVKKLIFKRKSLPLAKIYAEVNDIRKNIAHPPIGKREMQFADDIKQGLSYQKRLQTIFKSGTWGEDLFRRRR